VRRLAMLLAFGALWLFLLAVPAFADGGPHIAGQGGNLTPDSCAGCHRAHSAVAANLLVRDQMSLCYTCHGASATGSVLDVVDGISTASIGGGALRGGGVQFALLNTTTYTGNLIVGWGGNIPALATGAATSSHHSVDASAVTMWGNGPTPATVGDTSYGKAEKVNLSCGSCHDPHGNHQYRILKPGPSDSGIANGPYSEGVQAGRVYINDASAKTYTTTNYALIDGGATSAANVAGTSSGNTWNGGPNDGSQLAYNSTTKNWWGTYTAASSLWCATCHTRYNAVSGAELTPSGDAVYMFKHPVYTLINKDAPDNVFNGAWLSASQTGVPYNTAITPVQGTPGAGTTNHAPACLSCHVAHGTNASMTNTVKNQYSPGVNFNSTNQQVQGTDSQGLTNVHLTSTLLRLDNRGACQACHQK